ncbi:hypothetical protein [Rothia nasimurium]|uniref:hypothetical protein n=1 Tax=Rothia nasimurium TaxID=85336 RepID=UPI002DD621A0|nr:hypothetical protein [Rothia nasimurium]
MELSKGDWHQYLAGYEPDFSACIQSAHEDMSAAQEVSGMMGGRVYGQIWSKVLQEFLGVAKRRSNVTVVRLPNAGYSLIAIGPYLIFPWRFSDRQGVDPGDRPFAKSDARVKLFSAERQPSQLQLPIGFEGELSEGELSEDEFIFSDEIFSQYRVVIVAFASNPKSIHKIIWGEAELLSSGKFVYMLNQREIIIENGKRESVWDPDASFADTEAVDVPVRRKSKNKKNAE